MTQSAANPFPMPSCAECRALGIYIPPILSEIEEKFGAQMLFEFLRLNCGKRYWVCENFKDLPEGTVERYLSETLGKGVLEIPFGPMSFSIRRRAAVLRMLRAGKSVGVISYETGYAQRTVWGLKAEFRKAGLLPLDDEKQGK